MSKSIIPVSSLNDSATRLIQSFGRKMPHSEIYSENRSPEISSDTLKVLQQVDALKMEPSGSLSGFDIPYYSKVPKRSIREVLFDACAEVKILTSRVSMYLDADFRNNLFNQIDLLHEFEDWDSDEEPVNLLSFGSFLGWYFLAEPNKSAGIGLSSRGNLITAWMEDRNRLVIEFLPNDHAKWIVSRYEGDELERSSGRTTILRLQSVLSPYNIESFFHL